MSAVTKNAAQAPITLDEIWPELEKGLKFILTNLNIGYPPKDWMNLYTSVYNYCTRGSRQINSSKNGKNAGANFLGEELYNRVRDFLQQHTTVLLKGTEGKRNIELLIYYKKEWEQYTTAMSKLHHIFAYLNRNWIKRESEEQKKGVYEIYTLSLVTWRDHLFQSVREPLKTAILELIQKERNGEQIDTSLVGGVIKAFVSLSTASLGLTKDKSSNDITLDVYKQHLEDDFLQETEIYYTAESSHFIMINTVADYMKKVETRLAEETRRVETYLHESTLEDLIKKCVFVLIEKHKEHIQSEFSNLLEQDKEDDLTRMYALLSRINGGLEPLRSNFEKHVHKVGAQLIDEVAKTAINDPKQYVEELLKVYRKYNLLVVGPFKNDVGFVAALDRACRRFMNDNAVCKLAKSPAKSPELLAKFTDIILKKSNKNQEESELDELLIQVMIVFKYIEEKDVFMNVYSKLLAKRLIYATYASEDLESSMIGKLKSACGYEYTSKLQRMFTDMSLSRDLNEKFKSYAEGKKTDGVDFGILVLATGSWPLLAPSTNFSIPKELQECANTFQTFYQSQHTGRKLNWLHNLSKGEVKMRYATTNKAGYTLQCSAYQMGILLLFNQQDNISTKELQVATQLSENVLNNTLKTLLKTKVLNVDPKLADEKAAIEPSHVFSLNKAFKSPKGRMKVNINIRVEGETGGDGKKGEQSDDPMPAVIEERKILIQAAVVRIMKARKKAKHANLVSEVVTQLSNRFKPQIALIKRCIDILIEKEYLERLENEKDTYSYIA